MTQSKSISTLLKPVPEDSFPFSPGALFTYVPTIKGTDNSNLSISDLSCWQAHTNNMPHPTLSHWLFPSTCQRPLPGETLTKHMEASSHSFLGLNIQAHLEKQIKEWLKGGIILKTWRNTNGHLRKFHCSHLRYRIPQHPKLAGTSDTPEQLHTS